MLRADALLRLPGLGRRFAAIVSARDDFLSGSFLDGAAEAAFTEALVRFYEAVVPFPVYVEALRRGSGILRHALAHLLRGRESLLRRAARCFDANGPYHAAGLGGAFWSGLVQALDPGASAGWTPAIEIGLRRLGLARARPDAPPAEVYADIQDASRRIRSLQPELTVFHVDHFLTEVGRLRGRALGATPEEDIDQIIAAALQRVRAATPLRSRLKQRGEALAQARRRLEEGLATQDGVKIGAALTAAMDGVRVPALRWRAAGENLTLWVGRLWEADDPEEILQAFWRADPIAGAGLWLPAAVLHLKDPARFCLWNEATRRTYQELDGGASAVEPAEHRYRLYNEGLRRVMEKHRLHPLEVAPLLLSLAEPATETERFPGFWADSFRFLDELGRNNHTAWLQQQRERYRFSVRGPLVELCRALSERYVRPVLISEHGWDLETGPRSGRALSSICKNNYGRRPPYHTALWITFYRRGEGGRQDDVQFFVRLDAMGVSYGLRLGRAARATVERLQRNIRDHGELIFRALADKGALENCRGGTGDDPAAWQALTNREALERWAAGRAPVLARHLAAAAALATSPDLLGEIILTFDRLLPLYLCAVEDDPFPRLARHAGAVVPGDHYTEAQFRRATFLDEEWLRRARALLELKRQLILQGVPGTGKTHVAGSLARLLTRGNEDAIRLVQFHPAYAYEEFVEGIKVRSVNVDGRHDVTYPVEDGVLCAFAAQAARRPSEPHVLIIDEINRGNLPRIFGELLYLLEYRNRTIVLPYSKRSFELPANLYVLGTMNAADRSVALVDQALRRRFSFIDMPPDPAILKAWLQAHPPAEGSSFAEDVTALFVRLNARLRSQAGEQRQIGHSYFMVPELDLPRLHVIWTHHVLPLLEESLGPNGRAADYQLDELLHGGPSKSRGRKTAARASG